MECLAARNPACQGRTARRTPRRIASSPATTRGQPRRYRERNDLRNRANDRARRSHHAPWFRHSAHSPRGYLVPPPRFPNVGRNLATRRPTGSRRGIRNHCPDIWSRSRSAGPLTSRHVAMRTPRRQADSTPNTPVGGHPKVTAHRRLDLLSLEFEELLDRLSQIPIGLGVGNHVACLQRRLLRGQRVGCILQQLILVG